MAKRPTIADLADAAGVSLATVDRVLNRRHPVKEATALRVFDAAQAIGYHATRLIQTRLAAELPEIVLGVVLQKPDQDFYRNVRQAVEAAAQAFAGARIKLVIDHLHGPAPADIAAQITALGNRVQALALTSMDHPRIADAVADLQGRGVPVFALLSDFAQGVRQSYIGSHNLRVGRTAAWMIARRLPPGAEIGLFVGGHRWHGHALRETGFRSFFREAASEALVLDTQVNLDTADLTYEATLSLLARRPRLAGLYCAGGGMEGTVQAIRDEGGGRGIALVVNELTEISRLALSDGIAVLAIATPIAELAARVMQMAATAVTGAEVPGQVFVPMALHLPESL